MNRKLLSMDEQAELKRLHDQSKQDRKLIQRAAGALADIDRSQGLEDDHADVLAALRIRLEGRKRGTLEDLLSATGSISGKRDLKDALSTGEGSSKGDWPVVEEEKRDWPGT